MGFKAGFTWNQMLEQQEKNGFNASRRLPQVLHLAGEKPPDGTPYLALWTNQHKALAIVTPAQPKRFEGLWLGKLQLDNSQMVEGFQKNVANDCTCSRMQLQQRLPQRKMENIRWQKPARWASMPDFLSMLFAGKLQLTRPESYLASSAL